MPIEVQRQVFGNDPLRIANPVDSGPLRRVGKHRLAANLRPKAHAARRQGQPGLPAVQRVVVAVADEGTYARPVQPGQPVHELQLRPQAAVSSVVDVTGHQQGVHAFPKAQRDDVLVGVEGGAAQRIGDIIRRFAANAAKGAVQMQIGGVYKPQADHAHPHPNPPPEGEGVISKPTGRRRAIRSSGWCSARTPRRPALPGARWRPGRRWCTGRRGWGCWRPQRAGGG